MNKDKKKIDNEEKKNNQVKINLKDTEIEKVESGVFRHPENGRLLYKPDDEFEIKTCCGQITSCDKPLMEFIAKTTVSLSVLAFCFIQLSNRQQSEFASSTISLILGTYLGSSVNMMTNKKK